MRGSRFLFACSLQGGMLPRKRLVKWVLAHVEAPGSSWRPANSKAILQACGGQVYKALEQLGAGRGEQGKDDPTLSQTVWPSGLRRWLQAPVRKGVGSNPTAVMVIQHVEYHGAAAVTTAAHR